ncbi:hypothetical protein V1277_003869 [Bradyrhizobium sp. AZCC 1588]
MSEEGSPERDDPLLRRRTGTLLVQIDAARESATPSGNFTAPRGR